jgi:hypothetical protein
MGQGSNQTKVLLRATSKLESPTEVVYPQQATSGYAQQAAGSYTQQADAQQPAQQPA